jgi:O-antigen/teichoic acid export membrane protein
MSQRKRHDVGRSGGRTRDRLVRDIVGVFGTRAVWALLGAISGVILARWLGPHDRGVLALVLVLPATVMTLAKFGITQANVYFINREKAPVERVMANCMLLAVVLSFIAVTAVWLLRGTLQTSVLRDVPPWAVILALARVPLLLVDNYLYGVLQAVGKFALYNTRLLISELVRVVLVVVTVMVLGLGLPAAVATYTVIAAVMVTWLINAMRREIRFTPSAIDPVLLKRQLAFGAKSYVQTTAAHLLLRIDVYMVAYFLGVSETAFYVLALHFTELVLEIPQAIGLVLYPKLASMPEERAHQLTAQACRRTLLVTAPVALLLATIGPYMITLWYGRPYAPAGAPLPWAAVGVIAMSIFVTLTRDFTSRGRQQINIVAGTMALAANVAMNVFLIPALGIVGAAIATAISYSGACVLLLVFYCLESGISWIDVLIAKPEDIRFYWEMLRRAFVRGRRAIGFSARA